MFSVVLEVDALKGGENLIREYSYRYTAGSDTLTDITD